MVVFALLESTKLISRKIRVIEKSWNSLSRNKYFVKSTCHFAFMSKKVKLSHKIRLQFGQKSEFRNYVKSMIKCQKTALNFWLCTNFLLVRFFTWNWFWQILEALDWSRLLDWKNSWKRRYYTVNLTKYFLQCEHSTMWKKYLVKSTLWSKNVAFTKSPSPFLSFWASEFCSVI